MIKQNGLKKTWIILLFTFFCSLLALSSYALRAQKPVAVPSVANQTYRFIAFGDWGTGNSFQKQLASQINAFYVQTPFDAAFLLGDNIYEFGDVNKYGKAYFTDMYAPLLQAGVQFVVALGNHDRRAGFQDDQVRFFKMPGYYYRVQKPGIDFFVLDTNIFAKDEVQQRWLLKSLEESRARWQIVVAHHPIYSSGEHGLNVSLRETLEPILLKGGADVYLAGHDHDYERFAPIHGIQYIVSGGGGAYLRGFSKILPQSRVRLKVHHFLSFESNASSLKMEVHDANGKIVDSADWPLPKKQPVRLQSSLGASR